MIRKDELLGTKAGSTVPKSRVTYSTSSSDSYSSSGPKIST